MKMAGKSRRDFLKKSAVIGAGVTGLSTSTSKAGPKNILSLDKTKLNNIRKFNHPILSYINKYASQKCLSSSVELKIQKNNY
jgi:hypothetical protein